MKNIINKIVSAICRISFRMAFSQKDLDTLSDILHDYKDGHRGEKMFILPAMMIEARLKEITGGRYQPDTTYDTEDYTKEDLEKILDEVCECYAKEYNEGRGSDKYFMETNANGFYVNVREKRIEFEFTVMNDKFWKDVPFDTFYEEYGIDLNQYTHLFTY